MSELYEWHPLGPDMWGKEYSHALLMEMWIVIGFFENKLEIAINIKNTYIPWLSKYYLWDCSKEKHQDLRIYAQGYFWHQ